MIFKILNSGDFLKKADDQILQQKEAEINKRQEDILQIISSHNTIFNSKDYQMAIKYFYIM